MPSKPTKPNRKEAAPEQPARIYILAATEAPIAVLLRRKPTNLWHVALLRTDTGKLESGSWFRRTLFPEVCDLSPDGSLLVYHARGLKGVEWTAVCNPPSLEPLWHIPAYKTFGAGGAWIDNRTLVTFAGLKPEYIPQVPRVEGPRRRRSLFNLIHYPDRRANEAAMAFKARRDAEAEQVKAILPARGAARLRWPSATRGDCSSPAAAPLRSGQSRT